MLDSRTETFLTVCEEMNFTKAAKKLHISQPAVSQHIHYLEEYYQTRLFRFEGKRISLTDAGKLLQRSFLSLHNNELYLKEQLAIITNKRELLRFGATLTVGEFMIAAPLIRYLKAHTYADITVTVANTKELLQKLDTGDIDFALLEGDYTRSSYKHKKYRMENFIPICSPAHHFASPPHCLSDLTPECLIMREKGSGTRLIMEHLLTEADISLHDFKNTVTIGNMNAIKDLVMADCGITFLYETAVKKELEDGSIQKIELTDLHIEHEISIVWKKENLFEASFMTLFDELF